MAERSKTRAKRTGESARRGKKARSEPPRRKRPSRLEQFRTAHRWRLAFAKLAKAWGLTTRDLTARGTRSDAIKRLAEAVSDEVGFEVTYHTAWRFARSRLLPDYMEGSPPTPEEQLAAANQKTRRPGSGGRGRGADARVDELVELAAELVALTRRLRVAVQALGPILRERDDLHELLAASLAMVSRRE